MEDAATAEISRSQVWQWIRSPKGMLDDGRKVTKAMVAAMIPEEMAKIRDLLGAAFGEGRYDEAAAIFADLVNNDTFVEFLTLPAYEPDRSDDRAGLLVAPVAVTRLCARIAISADFIGMIRTIS